MKRTKRAPPDMAWWVRHPDFGLAIVSAPNWEQATIEAAKWWDVPWREAVVLCECEKSMQIPRNVCVRCGQIFHGDGLYCARCEAAERIEAMRRAAKARQYYRSMMPRGR